MLGRNTLMLIVLFSVSYAQETSPNPDVRLTTVQITRRNGYTSESHTILTKDGYFLTLHRIPRGVQTQKGKPRPPVFLQHGIMASSADWVLAGPNSALAYLLADAGYDVWMGNARGNKYSQTHMKFTTEQPEFWNFSWDEMAEFDLPAAIDYITKETGFDSLTYIGHSMGTTIFFALMASKPEYQKKVDLMVALAPVASVAHIAAPLKVLASANNILLTLGKMIGKGELVPGVSVIRYWKDKICSSWIPEKISEWWSGSNGGCADLLFGIAGYDVKNFKKGVPELIQAHFLQDTSLLTALQYAQQINSGRFSKFDRKECNKQRYNSTEPPIYDMSMVKTPVLVFTGDNDTFVHSQDVQNLQRTLSNIVKLNSVPNFNHIDYLYHVDAPKMVYNPILEELKERQKKSTEKSSRKSRFFNFIF